LDGGVSTYAYVEGDPLGSIDPLALSREHRIKVAQAIKKGDDAELDALLMGTIDAEAHALAQMARTPIGNLIPGSLKRSSSWAGELANRSYIDVCRIAREGGPLADKARRMLKLARDKGRLLEKTSGSGIR
jgi:hypothetical protein